ncbi:hypothetical protein [Saccharothrix sp. HUAS TT1]|uniref:hypothetical protein n=1 Tax=unclassified Saccharothrix TaxID=2593673 RepID=UPI00345BC6DC
MLSDTGIRSREAPRLLDGAQRASAPTRFLLGKGIATTIRRGLDVASADVPVHPLPHADVPAIRSVHRQPPPGPG